MPLVIKTGPWTIRPSLNRIETAKHTQNVGPRVMRLLIELLQHPNEVLSREYLLQKVWNDVIVNEESLTKSISFLRSYFNQNDEQYIETIRAVGYRWIGPIPELSNEPSTPLKTRSLPSLSRIGKVKVAAIASLASLALAILFTSINPKTPHKPELISLTDNKIVERVPRISPDGSSVLYAAITPTGGGMDIYVKNLKSDKIDRLTTSLTLDTDPVWSPQGDRVVFYKNNSEDVSIQEIEVKTLKQKKLVDVHEIPNLSAISWSPDGTFIAYCDRRSPADQWSIYLLNTLTRESKKLTAPNTNFYGDVSPRVSPDGKMVAFIRIRENGLLYKNLIPGIGEVYIMDIETGMAEKVFENDMEVSGVDWLDDGKHLALIKVNNYFTFEIAQLNIKSGAISTVYSTEKLLRNLSKANSRNDLVFEEWSERYSVWKGDLKEHGLHNMRPFMDISDKNWHPQTSHKGGHLAYISTRSGHSQLWIYDLKDKTDHQLTHITDGIIRNPRWSPDDSKILFETYRNKNFDLLSIDVATGDIEVITATERQERNASWSPDGKSIYYALREENRYDICHRNLITGEESLITETGAFAARATEFGIFYLAARSGAIYKYNPDGEDKALITDILGSDWFNWEVIDNNIYYVRRNPGRNPSLYRYDVTTAEKSDLSDNRLNFSNLYQGISIDANNGVVYATVNDFFQSDIKMLNGI